MQREFEFFRRASDIRIGEKQGLVAVSELGTTGWAVFGGGVDNARS